MAPNNTLVASVNADGPKVGWCRGLGSVASGLVDRRHAVIVLNEYSITCKVRGIVNEGPQSRTDSWRLQEIVIEGSKTC